MRLLPLFKVQESKRDFSSSLFSNQVSKVMEWPFSAQYPQTGRVCEVETFGEGNTVCDESRQA